jgi:hypothetical protein
MSILFFKKSAGNFWKSPGRAEPRSPLDYGVPFAASCRPPSSGLTSLHRLFHRLVRSGLRTQSLGSHLYPAQQDSARWGHRVGRFSKLLPGLTRLSWVSPAGFAVPSLALCDYSIAQVALNVNTFF